MKEKRLHEKMSKLNWGPSDDELPRYTLEQVSTLATLPLQQQWVVTGSLGIVFFLSGKESIPR